VKTVLPEKPRLLPLSTDAERAALNLGRRGINGFRDLQGNYWGYAYSVARYRARMAKLKI